MITKTTTPGTWTSANGSIRITSQRTKRHGKPATLYTATLNAGTAAWRDVGEGHTLGAIEAILASAGLL